MPAARAEEVVFAGGGVTPRAGEVGAAGLPDEAGEGDEAGAAHGSFPEANDRAIVVTPC